MISNKIPLFVLIVVFTCFKFCFSQTTNPEIFSKALEYYYGANYQEAIPLFDEYIKSLSNDPRGYQYRGLCYQGMRNFPRAIEDFTNEIRVAQNNGDGYVNRGNTYFLDNNFPAAMRDFTDAVRVNSSEVEGYMGRSRVYVVQREFSNALSDLIRASGIDPYNSRVYINMAWVNILDDDTTKAFDNISKALYYDSNIVFTDYKRDQLFVKLESYKLALALANQSIQFYPEGYLHYFTRGMIYFLMNKYDFAIEDFKKSLLLNKNGSKQFVEVMEKILRSIKRNI
ncbi:MAG: tetratricopeptide repeat protein [Ignavibacteria bacterium]